jgi:hypothetical protein
MRASDKILRKKKSDYTEEDLDHMRKVTGYVKRHLKQKPKNDDVEDSRWRYSLMHWGYDPPQVTDTRPSGG